MDTNSLVIITGLIAALIAYAAVQDAGASSPPTTMQWRFGESWTTSAAAIAAIAAIGFLGAEEGMTVVFAFMLLLGPLLYKGVSGSGNGSMGLFLVVGTLMGWATLAILTQVTSLVFFVTRDELTLIPRLLMNGVAVAALLAAVLSIHTALRSAVSGSNIASQGAWTLP